MTTYNSENTSRKCNESRVLCNSTEYDLLGRYIFRDEAGTAVSTPDDGYGPEIYADNMDIDADTLEYYADGANAFWSEVGS